MQQCLLKMLIFMSALSIFNTIINVIHKIGLIEGPPAHVAMALLSMGILFGYSGILNTLFLKRKFMVGPMGSQTAILVLSILSWCNVITYALAIDIIHALVGVIATINFACAVLCVDQQRQEMDAQDIQKQKQRLKKQLATLEILCAKRQSIDNESLLNGNYSIYGQNNENELSTQAQKFIKNEPQQFIQINLQKGVQVQMKSVNQNGSYIDTQT